MNAMDLKVAMWMLYRVDREQFVNALRSIDIWPAEVIQGWWREFKSDPVNFYARSPDSMCEALFALIQKHLDEGKNQ